MVIQVNYTPSPGPPENNNPYNCYEVMGGVGGVGKGMIFYPAMSFRKSEELRYHTRYYLHFSGKIKRNLRVHKPVSKLNMQKPRESESLGSSLIVPLTA